MVFAELNHDRWLVRCPNCPSALLADPLGRSVHWNVRGPDGSFTRYDTHAFTCYDCGAGPFPIGWPSPDERAAISEATGRRPIPARNWEHGDDLARLHAENVAHGVG